MSLFLYFALLFVSCFSSELYCADRRSTALVPDQKAMAAALQKEAALKALDAAMVAEVTRTELCLLVVQQFDTPDFEDANTTYGTVSRDAGKKVDTALTLVNQIDPHLAGRAGSLAVQHSQLPNPHVDQALHLGLLKHCLTHNLLMGERYAVDKFRIDLLYRFITPDSYQFLQHKTNNTTHSTLYLHCTDGKEPHYTVKKSTDSTHSEPPRPQALVLLTNKQYEQLRPDYEKVVGGPSYALVINPTHLPGSFTKGAFSEKYPDEFFFYQDTKHQDSKRPDSIAVPKGAIYTIITPPTPPETDWELVQGTTV